MATNTQLPPGYVLMCSRNLASMQAGGVDVKLAALQRETLTQVDNSAHI